jgi:hypothetical protein
MERRKLTRIAYFADTKVVHDYGSLEGVIKNLSIGGVFVKTCGQIEVNSKVNLIIFLGGSHKPPIDIQGIVNRKENDGIAIKFNDYTELNKKLFNTLN